MAKKVSTLELGERDILVINFPESDRGTSRELVEKAVDRIMAPIRQIGIDIPDERIVVVCGTTFSKIASSKPVVGHLSDATKLQMALGEIDALKEDVKRWKFVAKGGHHAPTTEDLLGDVADTLEGIISGEGGGLRREVARDQCQARARFLRSHRIAMLEPGAPVPEDPAGG